MGGGATSGDPGGYLRGPRGLRPSEDGRRERLRTREGGDGSVRGARRRQLGCLQDAQVSLLFGGPYYSVNDWTRARWISSMESLQGDPAALISLSCLPPTMAKPNAKAYSII